MDAWRDQGNMTIDGHDDADARPWEQPGAVRRDCEPHRGHFLKVLGQVSFGFAGFALCAMPAGLIALILGVIVLFSSTRDLRAMDAGRMDPTGREVIHNAQEWVVLSFILALIGMFGHCFGMALFLSLFLALLCMCDMKKGK
jgi:hypothetical protein